MQYVLLVQVPELYLGYELSLEPVDAETLHQCRHDVLVATRIPDYPYSLVDIEQDQLESGKQMEFIGFYCYIVLQLPLDAAHPEGQPFLEDLAHAQNLRDSPDEDIEITCK